MTAGTLGVDDVEPVVEMLQLRFVVSTKRILYKGMYAE